MLDFSSEDKQSLPRPDGIQKCPEGCLASAAILDMQVHSETLGQAHWGGCKPDRDRCWCGYGEWGTRYTTRGDVKQCSHLGGQTGSSSANYPGSAVMNQKFHSGLSTDDRFCSHTIKACAQTFTETLFTITQSGNSSNIQ